VERSIVLAQLPSIDDLAVVEIIRATIVEWQACREAAWPHWSVLREGDRIEAVKVTVPAAAAYPDGVPPGVSDSEWVVGIPLETPIDEEV